MEKTAPKIHPKPGKILNRLFWIMILIFFSIFVVVLFIGSPIGPYSAVQFAGTLFFPFTIIFITISVSIVFLVYSIKERIDKLFKSFLILTGISAAGFSFSFLTRILVFAIFNKGPFWSNLISTYNITLNIISAIFLGLLFPLGFVIGMLVSIVFFIIRRKK